MTAESSRPRGAAADGHRRDYGLPTLPRRPSTAEHAASVLRTQVANGALVPGTRLREEHVAESFGISRNTVREVFSLLAHERLIEHIPYRGAYIRRLETDDIRAMYYTRRLVEPLGVHAALSEPTVQHILREICDSASAAADREDWQQVGTHDIGFHRALVHACRSTHLSDMFELLLAELRLAFLQLPDPRALHRPYLARNRRLLDLIEKNDTAAALVELTNYLNSAEREVLDKIQ